MKKQQAQRIAHGIDPLPYARGNVMDLRVGGAYLLTSDNVEWQKVGNWWRTELTIKPGARSFTVALPFENKRVACITINGSSILQGDVQFQKDGRLTIDTPWDGKIVLEISA